MKELRTGFTTGLCAAAAAKAAAITLLSEDPAREVYVKKADGIPVRFVIEDAVLKNGTVVCSVRKDAGDDPDITDGLMIRASTAKKNVAGVEIGGGEGIGRVTKPGLKVGVGKAAINPAPMEMIRTAVEEACGTFGYEGGMYVELSIPGGAEIAKKTMNERLGILGGLSILGTTGIVEPMSDRAVIETIKAEIDVHLASGSRDLLVTPGNYGRDFAEERLGLDIGAAVKCSNFIGETLDHACLKAAASMTLIGHAGKLVKLAGGIMNTHSAVADCRMEIIAAHSALAGAGIGTIQSIMECVTVEAAINLLERDGLNGPVWASIGERIGFHLRERTRGELAVEYIVFTQEHGVLVRGTTQNDG